ncbi:MAG TPA: hypothetical protein DGP89_03040 [Saprospirales bacterium]|nr:hypothetical protein [Saprospirales bacterium]
MKTAKIKTMLFWLFLNVAIALTMDLAMFMQTTPDMKEAGFWKKLAVSEFFATIEWMFIIPSNRLGNKFLTAAQVSLSSFVFDFLGQIASNTFWLKLPTTLDDYVGMVLIMIGMAISTYKVFG